MNITSLGNWLQTIGTIGLLIGVVLVIVQINQNSQLVREQIYQQRLSDRYAWRHAMLGENPAVALEKAILKPTEVTLADHIVIDAYLTRYLEY